MSVGLIRDRRGSVAVLSAFWLMIGLALAALAVDVGFVMLKSRQLQGAADLGALAAASDFTRAQAAAQATAESNGWSDGLMVAAVTGSYDGSTATPVADRFSAGASQPNAVKVTMTARVPLFFGAAVTGRPSMTITRTAIARRPNLAAFSLGSGLASLDGGIENALLSSLTGSTVSLSLADYNALASAKVDLLQYAQALKVSAHPQAASFNDALQTHTSVQMSLGALATVLDRQSSIVAAAAVRQLSAATPSSKTVELDQLLNLGPYGDQDNVVRGGLFEVSAGDLANALLVLSGQGRQVKLSLGASIPGLANTDVWLAIGQRPSHTSWLTINDDGSQSVYTNQARLYVVSTIGVAALAPITAVKLPLLVEAASAEAKVSSIDCAAGSVNLLVKPSIGSLKIGDINTSALNDFTTPLNPTPSKIVDLSPIATVTAAGNVSIGGASYQSLNFSSAEVAAHTVKTAYTTDTAQATVATLISNTNLSVNTLGLALGVSLAKTGVAQALTAAAPPLDGLVNGLTNLLGVHLGRADVQIDGVRCGAAALAA